MDWDPAIKNEFHQTVDHALIHAEFPTFHHGLPHGLGKVEFSAFHQKVLHALVQAGSTPFHQAEWLFILFNNDCAELEKTGKL
jgi:hypothetical protein